MASTSAQPPRLAAESDSRSVCLPHRSKWRTSSITRTSPAWWPWPRPTPPPRPSSTPSTTSASRRSAPTTRPTCECQAGLGSGEDQRRAAPEPASASPHSTRVPHCPLCRLALCQDPAGPGQTPLLERGLTFSSLLLHAQRQPDPLCVEDKLTVIPALAGRLRQEDCKSEANLGSLVRSHLNVRSKTGVQLVMEHPEFKPRTGREKARRDPAPRKSRWAQKTERPGGGSTGSI